MNNIRLTLFVASCSRHVRIDQYAAVESRNAIPTTLIIRGVSHFMILQRKIYAVFGSNYTNTRPYALVEIVLMLNFIFHNTQFMAINFIAFMVDGLV